MKKVVSVGTSTGSGARWAAFLHFERDGVPEVVMLSPVSSHAEAEQRQRDNAADSLVMPQEVLQEMIDAGVGPQVA